MSLPKGKGTGGKNGGARSPSPKKKPQAGPSGKVPHCFQFAKGGKCDKGKDCTFPHIAATEIEKIKAKAAGKGKKPGKAAPAGDQPAGQQPGSSNGGKAHARGAVPDAVALCRRRRGARAARDAEAGGR